MSAQQSKRARRLARDIRWAAKGGRWRGATILQPGCPTPAKRRFNSREAAETNASGKRAYRCPCGEWHLATRRAS